MNYKEAQKNFVKARTSVGLRGKQTQPGDLIMASLGNKPDRPKASAYLKETLNQELKKTIRPKHLVAI